MQRNPLVLQVRFQKGQTTYDLANVDMMLVIGEQTLAFPYAQSQVRTYHSEDS
jgi:hypothetical protein